MVRNLESTPREGPTASVDIQNSSAVQTGSRSYQKNIWNFYLFSWPWQQGGEDRSFSILLDTINDDINRDLESAFRGEKPIPIEEELRFNNVESVVSDHHGQRAGLTRETVLEAFNRNRSSLLILGASGSGKSISLVQIQKHILSSALWRDRGKAPVILPLTSWSGKIRFLKWMALEVQSRYRINKKLAEKWFRQGRLIPLFDSLDEVARERRPSCIRALNEYISDMTPIAVAVCCRPAEYRQAGVRLKLECSYTISPLSPTAISNFLGDHPNLSDLAQDFRLFPELSKIASSPFILTKLAEAYNGGEAFQPLADTNSDQLRQNALELYMHSVINRARKRRNAPSQEDLNRWIPLLAQMFVRFNITTLQVDRLQMSLLKGWSSKVAYIMISRCLQLIVPYTFIGLASGLGGSVSQALKQLEQRQDISSHMSKVMSAALAFSLVIGLCDFLKQTIIQYRPALIGRLQNRIHGAVFYMTVLTVLGAALQQSDSELLFPIWAGIIFGIRASRHEPGADINFGRFYGWRAAGMVKGFVYSLPLVVALLSYGILKDRFWYTLIYMAPVILIASLWGGYIERPPTPNERNVRGPYLWLRSSIFTALPISFVATLGFAITGLAVDHFQNGTAGTVVSWLEIGFAKGIMVFVAIFFLFGGFDFLQHATLRVFLACQGVLPLRLVTLLDKMAEMEIMSNRGAGYSFAHNEVRDYLAGAHHADQEETSGKCF